MAISGLTSYGQGSDAQERTAGLRLGLDRYPVENSRENIKGPRFSDHLSSASLRPDEHSRAPAAHEERSAKSAASSSTGTPAPFSFWDIIDIINPLQHIPVVSTLYRHLTGDEIRNSSRLVGDAIYGGALGAAASLVDIAFKNATGKDAGETVMAMLTNDGESPSDSGTALAQNDLNTIAPASGPAVSINDIIWAAPPKAAADITRFLPPGTPTKPERTPAAENPKMVLHIRESSGPDADRGTTSEGSGLTASRTVDSPSFLSSQETPAAAAEHGVPPALIAQKMMQALDAYGAMKKQGLQP